MKKQTTKYPEYSLTQLIMANHVWLKRVDYNGIPVPENCDSCGEPLPLKVCRSNAGYYLGTWCPNCGPYSRESGYFPLPELAEKALTAIKEALKQD